MYKISSEEFTDLVRQSVEKLPKVHKDRLKNVGIFVRDEPSQDQIIQSELKPGHLLLGLYSGVPLTGRQGMTKLTPDIITIFQLPIEFLSNSREELEELTANTVWHEVAHYFGLNHERIYSISATRKHNGQ